MKYEKFTELQRPSFRFRFSFGESHGSYGSEQAHLNSETIIAYDRRLFRDPYPHEQGVGIRL